VFVTTLTRKTILDSLRDKETRELFAEEHISTGLPFQIHGLREKLGVTQAELARRAGMAQERISVLEDPNYEFQPKIKTLVKLANVFDVPLIVKFGSWSELFNWETSLSPERLAPKSFEEEIDALEEAAFATTYVSAATITAYAVPGDSLFWHDHGHTDLRWRVVPEHFAPNDDWITLNSAVIRLKTSEPETDIPLIDTTEDAIAELPEDILMSVPAHFFKKTGTTDIPTVTELVN
jgi:transcriptional regulator with XRE-family HTH domain